LLRAPVKIDALMEEWTNDSPINDLDPVKELGRIPVLHSKYLNVLTYHNLVVKKLTSDFATQKQIALAWHRGDLNNPDDLAKHNLEPNLSPSPNNALAQIKLDADVNLNKILAKKMIHEEIVSYCDKVLKELNARTFQLNSMVKYIIFTGGM
jgi:Recombination, repair and ssDNA binding protein UvsY